jgi:hypothetical protein
MNPGPGGRFGGSSAPGGATAAALVAIGSEIMVDQRSMRRHGRG